MGLALTIGLLGPPGEGFSQTRPSKVVLEETKLGSTTGYDSLKSFAVGTDSENLAFVATRGQKQYVVRDGVESPAYDWIIPSSLTLSPVDHRAAFIIQQGDDMSVVVGGQVVGKGYFRICDDRIVFSHDGKHFAYTAQVGQQGALVVRDGVAGKLYQSVPAPLFSPDGTHLAYQAMLPSGKRCVILDGQEQKAYDAISPGTIQFSQVGNHLAYTAIQDRKVIAVVDGKEISKPLDALALVFSPTGDHIAYFAGTDKECSVVLDGKPGPSFDSFGGPPVFSPDAKHLAYVSMRQKQGMVILDGIGQEPFDEVAGESLTFSADSRHLAYAAGKSGQRFVVLDGKRQAPFDHITRPGLLFSPDGKRLAYPCLHGQQFVVVCDGVEGARFDWVNEMWFSSDSRHFAYSATANRQQLIVMDSQPSSPFDALTAVSFSPDGAHWMYVGRRDATGESAATIVVDGEDAAATYTGFVRGSNPVFRSRDTAVVLMLRGNDVLRVLAHFNAAHP